MTTVADDAAPTDVNAQRDERTDDILCRLIAARGWLLQPRKAPSNSTHPGANGDFWRDGA